jgi:hypothetical protein
MQISQKSARLVGEKVVPLNHELDAASTARLRQRALAYVRAGILPRFSNQHLSGGLGPSATCALCLQRIQVEDLRYLVERGNGEHLFELHIACFLAWEHSSLQLFQ